MPTTTTEETVAFVTRIRVDASGRTMDECRDVLVQFFKVISADYPGEQFVVMHELYERDPNVESARSIRAYKGRIVIEARS